MRTWWLSVVLLSACGGGGAKSVPLGELGKALEEALCDMAIDCGTVADRSECTGDLDTRQLEASVKAGKIRYDGALAAKCLDLFSTSCSMPFVDDDSCDAVFKGTLAVGAACLSNSECASARCDLSACDPDAACCRGACLEARPTIPVGGKCAFSDAACAKGAYCDYVTPSADSVCKLIESKREGEACDGARSCALGLFCKEDTKVCARPPKRGEACEPDQYNCPYASDYCDTETLVCTPKKAVGQPCQGFLDCVSSAECSDAKVCVARGKEGEACATVSCASGLDCQGDVCVKPTPEPVCP
jgi:hypothetical protein